MGPHVAQTPAASQGLPSDTLTQGSLGFEDQGATASFSKHLHQKARQAWPMPGWPRPEWPTSTVFAQAGPSRPWRQPQGGSVRCLRTQGWQVTKPEVSWYNQAPRLLHPSYTRTGQRGRGPSTQVNDSWTFGQQLKMEASSPFGGEPTPKHWDLSPQSSPPTA